MNYILMPLYGIGHKAKLIYAWVLANLEEDRYLDQNETTSLPEDVTIQGGKIPSAAIYHNWVEGLLVNIKS